MKLVTRDTDYAIRALCFIAKRKSDIVSVTELVKNLKISRSFLRKILQVLNKEGILTSQKGKGGGFRLALSPDKIFVTDLIKIFQGPFRLNECILKKDICPEITNCILKSKIDEIERDVSSKLESISIKKLLVIGEK